MPQHLELDDVIAWGLGAVDLACIAGGAVIGWWVWELLAADLDVRTALAAPFVVIGVAFGALRMRDRTLREWTVLVGAYALRARLLLIGASG